MESPSASEEPAEVSNASVKLSRLSLNPNAREFVPSSSKSSEVNSSSGGAAKFDRTSSANSNTSDDEFRQFWRSQLPDDLISDSDFADIFSEATQYDQHDRNAPRNGEHQKANGSSPHDQQAADKKHPWLNGVDGVQEPDEVHPLTLLAAEFPNFAAQSLADIYYANGGDLGLTIEMLTQLELQDEGAPSRRAPRPVAAVSLTPMDFPSLPGVDMLPGSRMVAPSLGRRFGEQGVDFAAVVRKQAPQQWGQYERNGSDMPLASARSSAPGLSSYAYGNREPPRMMPQPWLQTGEAVASLYSDMREEARDYARVRNAYFQQARQAYLIGNKALAKELSAKGQWHNEQMKLAHGKAAEAIFQQRNSSLVQLSRDGQRMIDLHGLHVNEAIPLLKRELAAMKMASRTTSKRQCVYVCVGTGHHSKGSRNQPRVPIAIERYLAEEERIQFQEVQPGMLRVIV